MTEGKTSSKTLSTPPASRPTPHGSIGKGYVQVYTGSGKGKTTAALGLAMRAAGAGLRVFIGQFIKNEQCSEHWGLERFGDAVTIRQYGRGFIGKGGATEADIRAAAEGMHEIGEAVRSGSYDVVVLDEINVAVHYGLVDVDQVVRLIEEKPEGVELIVTGRYAHERVIAAADLVTEMREIKHYSDKGVKARVGIEK